MFDAILYFYQSKGVFKPPTNIDEDIVNNELEFYKISLDKIFADVEQASKKMLVPTSAKQKVSFPLKICDKYISVIKMILFNSFCSMPFNAEIMVVSCNHLPSMIAPGNFI